MSWLTVLYIAALAGAFTGCGAFLHVVRLRHRDPEETGEPRGSEE